MGAGFPVGGRQLQMLILMLLAMLFFMLMFRGKVPRAVERVFSVPDQSSAADVQSRRAEVAKILDGAYHDPADGAPFAETPGYGRLLRKLVDHAPAAAVVDPPLFNRSSAMVVPELQRGETVKVRGIVAAHWAVKLDHPAFEMRDIWRVFLTDGEGEDGLVVDVVDRPPVLEERREAVEIVGTFYRLVSYDSKSGKRLEVPYLLARSLVVATDEAGTSVSRNPAFIVLLVGLGAMVVWGVLRVVSARARPQGIRWRAPHLG